MASPPGWQVTCWGSPAPKWPPAILPRQQGEGPRSVEIQEQSPADFLSAQAQAQCPGQGDHMQVAAPREAAARPTALRRGPQGASANADFQDLSPSSAHTCVSLPVQYRKVVCDIYDLFINSKLYVKVMVASSDSGAYRASQCPGLLCSSSALDHVCGLDPAFQLPGPLLSCFLLLPSQSPRPIDLCPPAPHPICPVPLSTLGAASQHL